MQVPGEQQRWAASQIVLTMKGPLGIRMRVPYSTSPRHCTPVGRCSGDQTDFTKYRKLQVQSVQRCHVSGWRIAQKRLVVSYPSPTWQLPVWNDSSAAAARRQQLACSHCMQTRTIAAQNASRQVWTQCSRGAPTGCGSTSCKTGNVVSRQARRRPSCRSPRPRAPLLLPCRFLLPPATRFWRCSRQKHLRLLCCGSRRRGLLGVACCRAS